MLATLGEAGFDCETPDDLTAWISEEPKRFIFLTVDSDEDWALLARLHRAHPDVLIVAMLHGASDRDQARALMTGAVSAVRRDSPPPIFRQVLEAAIQGVTLIPIEVLRILTSGDAPPTDWASEPSSRELDWLGALATGTTVAGLAERTGYSERAMFRQLGKLYAKLGVKNRTEALMRARGRGWL